MKNLIQILSTPRFLPHLPPWEITIIIVKWKIIWLFFGCKFRDFFFGSQKKAKNNVLRIATRIFSAPTRTHSIFSILANQNYYCCCWPNFFFFKNRKISTADVDTMMMMIMMKSSEKAQVKTTIKYNDNKKKCKKKTLFFFLLKKKKRNQTANQCRQKNITFILTLFSPIHKGRKRKKLMTDKQLLVLFFCESKTFF